MRRRSLLAGLAALPAAAAPLRLPKKIRLGMVGLDGHPGEILGPLPDLPDVELVAFAETNPANMKRFMARPDAAKIRTYGNHRDLLAKEELDVFAVCNGNHERAQAVLDGLARGLHVISEKPYAIEDGDWEKVRAAVRKGPGKVGALFPMRYSSPYLALKQIVDSGEIGEVVQMDAQKSYKASERAAWYYKRSTYGGTMPWIGIHMIDLMLFTSGRNLVEAFGWQNHLGFPESGEMENVSGTVFKMDNGGVALLRMDYLRPKTAKTHGDDRLRLAGLTGIAEYMEATGVTVVSNKRGREVISSLPAPRNLFPEFLDHVYNGKPATLKWQEIERAHQIVLGARAAMESGKARRL